MKKNETAGQQDLIVPILFFQISRFIIRMEYFKGFLYKLAE
jgi:hypothetical protein